MHDLLAGSLAINKSEMQKLCLQVWSDHEFKNYKYLQYVTLQQDQIPKISAQIIRDDWDDTRWRKPALSKPTNGDGTCFTLIFFIARICPITARALAKMLNQQFDHLKCLHLNVTIKITKDSVCIYIYFSNSPRVKLYFNRSEHISKYININPISTCNNKFLNQVNLRSSLAWSNPSHWHGWKAWVVMAMSPRTIVDP